MANALPVNYKNLILGSGNNALPDMDTDSHRATLVDHGVATPDPATHDDLADYAAGVIAESGNLASASIASGAIDFADFTFSTVTGASCESLCFHLETGTDGTSTFWLFIDTATGLPITPNGGDINVVLNASGLFTF